MIWLALQFAGGVGLFLLGMRLMTDGLKVAAGEALRGILSRWTSTIPRGIFSGILITTLVQSSSAVIFATIGFVNAGLLSLMQAVAVIYGSNVGTTFTSWLVALVGFHVDLKLLSLPSIGLGMLLRTAASRARPAALGEALTGFGVFFLGIDVLKGTFAGMEQVLDIAAMGDGTGLSALLFVIAGTVMTVLMQSSSAALAVTLTATAAGLIPLTAAAGVVIGANVGTTSTAAFAVIGATSNAKRAALAHVVFNVIGGGFALLALPVLLQVVGSVETALGLEEAPATSLAVFHTLINVVGLLLLAPFTRMLVGFLETRFKSAEEDEGRARHLDGNIVTMPSLALNALVLELGRIGAIARRASKGAISTEVAPGRRLETDRLIIDRLIEAAGTFTNRVQHANLPKDLSEAFPQALRVTQYYEDMVERAMSIATLAPTMRPIDDQGLARTLADAKAAAVHLVDDTDVMKQGFSLESCETRLNDWQGIYQNLKTQMLRVTAEGQLGIRQMEAHLDELSAVRRILDQAVKAARYLSALKEMAGRHSKQGDNAAA